MNPMRTILLFREGTRVTQSLEEYPFGAPGLRYRESLIVNHFKRGTTLFSEGSLSIRERGIT